MVQKDGSEPHGGEPQQAASVEPARAVDESRTAVEGLPSLDAVPRVDYPTLSARIAEIPDEVNSVLRLVDGRRSLSEIIALSEHDEVVTAATLARLHAEHILEISPAGRDTGVPPPDVEPGSTREPPVAVPVPPRIVRFPPRPRTADASARAPGPPTQAVPNAEAGPQVPPPSGESAPDPRQAAGPAPAPRRAARWAGLAVAVLLALAVATLVATNGRPLARAQRRPPADPGQPPAAILPAPIGQPPAAAEPPLAAPAQPGQASEVAAPAPADLDAEYERAYAAARAAYAAGDPIEAIAQYRRALDLRETTAAQAGLGLALHGVHQDALAIEALQRALELDGSNAVAYIGLGRIYREEDRADEARAAFGHYLELQPDGSDAAEARAALTPRP